MTSTDKAILTIIEHLKKSPLTCTQVGAALWGKPHRKWQAYARPGGRLMHHMKRLGIVEQYYDGKHFFLWKLTANWKSKVPKPRKAKPLPPHIKATKKGFTHWSSGPGNLTFDPDCPRCRMDARQSNGKDKV